MARHQCLSGRLRLQLDRTQNNTPAGRRKYPAPGGRCSILPKKLFRRFHAFHHADLADMAAHEQADSKVEEHGERHAEHKAAGAMERMNIIWSISTQCG